MVSGCERAPGPELAQFLWGSRGLRRPKEPIPYSLRISTVGHFLPRTELEPNARDSFRRDLATKRREDLLRDAPPRHHSCSNVTIQPPTPPKPCSDCFYSISRGLCIIWLSFARSSNVMDIISSQDPGIRVRQILLWRCEPFDLARQSSLPNPNLSMLIVPFAMFGRQDRLLTFAPDFPAHGVYVDKRWNCSK
jgi:hypothetical protein